MFFSYNDFTLNINEPVNKCNKSIKETSLSFKVQRTIMQSFCLFVSLFFVQPSNFAVYFMSDGMSLGVPIISYSSKPVLRADFLIILILYIHLAYGDGRGKFLSTLTGIEPWTF